MLRWVGYAGYDTPKQVVQVNALYAVYRLYLRRFLPVTKPVKTGRHGSRIKKIYDAPRTAYQRVLDAPQMNPKVKTNLGRDHAKLGVALLKRKVVKLVATLKPTRQW